jgi:protein phosphatase PTC1
MQRLGVCVCVCAHRAGEDMEEYLIESFQLMQQELEHRHIHDGTAALAILLDTASNLIHCANAGDSRAILCKHGGGENGDEAVIVALSDDHKPESQRERERIRQAGGFVTESKRVNGVLALSRALGDCDLQPLVYYKPDILTVPYGDDADFIIIGCDGLWDVASNEDAVRIVKATTTAQDAAFKLRDHAFMMGSTDNISVIVIRFDTRGSRE